MRFVQVETAPARSVALPGGRGGPPGSCSPLRRLEPLSARGGGADVRCIFVSGDFLLRDSVAVTMLLFEKKTKTKTKPRKLIIQISAPLLGGGEKDET